MNGCNGKNRSAASLPVTAPIAAKVAPVANALQGFAGLAGFSKSRSLPKFQTPFKGKADGEVLLFADTFNCHFDPEASTQGSPKA